MSTTYSLYEAKAKFSEVMRKVRAGQRIVIAYRREEIAEIRPIDGPGAREATGASGGRGGSGARARAARDGCGR